MPSSSTFLIVFNKFNNEVGVYRFDVKTKRVWVAYGFCRMGWMRKLKVVWLHFVGEVI